MTRDVFTAELASKVAPLRSMRLLTVLPLLAGSQDAVRALGLGIAALIALCLTQIAVIALKRLRESAARLLALVIVIAVIVTMLDLALRAWLPELQAAMGLFVPLIASSCVLLGTLETFVPGRSSTSAIRTGWITGVTGLMLLLATGMLRELLGTGHLFAHAGTWLYLPMLEMDVLPGYSGFLIATLPAGALLIAAALIALHQAWQQGRKHRESA